MMSVNVKEAEKFEPTGKLVFKCILKFDIETLTYKSKLVAMWCTHFLVEVT